MPGSSTRTPTTRSSCTVRLLSCGPAGLTVPDLGLACGRSAAARRARPGPPRRPRYAGVRAAGGPAGAPPAARVCSCADSAGELAQLLRGAGRGPPPSGPAAPARPAARPARPPARRRSGRRRRCRGSMPCRASPRGRAGDRQVAGRVPALGVRARAGRTARSRPAARGSSPAARGELLGRQRPTPRLGVRPAVGGGHGAVAVAAPGSGSPRSSASRCSLMTRSGRYWSRWAAST